MKTSFIKTSKPYQVLMGEGLLDQAGPLCRDTAEKCRICIVSDENVHRLYTDRTESSLHASGFDVYKVTFPAGEATKSMDSVKKLLSCLASAEFTRSDILLALGGGVIGDLTGFTAAIYLRGIEYIQAPTTFLAAADASVGGKTAVDLPEGKNLAGAFWQPSLVIFDTETTDTLTHDCLLDGLAEALKCGVIADPELFGFIRDSDTGWTKTFIERCVSDAVRVKQSLVEQDEKDTGQRQLLNFGHTFAHAIEKCSSYSITHGHAVALGMAAAAKASRDLGWSQEDCYGPLVQILSKYGFPSACPYNADTLLEAAMKDKKRTGGKIRIVVPLRIGECALREIPVPELGSFFRKGL